MFAEGYSLGDCEKEQESPSWTLAGSQICLLIYNTSSRSLVVCDALRPLLAEDERLISSNFLFIIATPKLNEVNLEKALQVAAHITIWLVRKDQVNLFKSQWTEEHQSGRHRTIASPKIQPAPPDAGDNLGDDTLFDDDSIDDRSETSVSIESRASDARVSLSQHVDANNSALVVLSALNRVPRAHITMPSEADTSRPVTSPHRPSITASLEEEPRGEAPSSVAVSRVVNRTIDSADETAELSSMAPPPPEDTSN